MPTSSDNSEITELKKLQNLIDSSSNFTNRSDSTIKCGKFSAITIFDETLIYEMHDGQYKLVEPDKQEAVAKQMMRDFQAVVEDPDSQMNKKLETIGSSFKFQIDKDGSLSLTLKQQNSREDDDKILFDELMRDLKFAKDFKDVNRHHSGELLRISKLDYPIEYATPDEQSEAIKKAISDSGGIRDELNDYLKKRQSIMAASEIFHNANHELSPANHDNLLKQNKQKYETYLEYMRNVISPKKDSMGKSALSFFCSESKDKSLGEQFNDLMWEYWRVKSNFEEIEQIDRRDFGLFKLSDDKKTISTTIGSSDFQITFDKDKISKVKEKKQGDNEYSLASIPESTEVLKSVNEMLRQEIEIQKIKQELQKYRNMVNKVSGPKSLKDLEVVERDGNTAEIVVDFYSQKYKINFDSKGVGILSSSDGKEINDERRIKILQRGLENFRILNREIENYSQPTYKAPAELIKSLKNNYKQISSEKKFNAGEWKTLNGKNEFEIGRLKGLNQEEGMSIIKDGQKYQVLFKDDNSAMVSKQDYVDGETKLKFTQLASNSKEEIEILKFVLDESQKVINSTKAGTFVDKLIKEKQKSNTGIGIFK